MYSIIYKPQNMKKKKRLENIYIFVISFKKLCLSIVIKNFFFACSFILLEKKGLTYDPSSDCIISGHNQDSSKE